MFSRLADATSRRPKRWLLAALAVVLLAAALGGPVAGLLKSTGGFDDPGSQSIAARERIEQATGRQVAPGVIALVRPAGGVGSAAGRRAVADVSRTLRADPAVAAVDSYATTRDPRFLASDRRSTYVAATLAAAADEDQVAKRLESGLAGRRDVALGGPAVASSQSVRADHDRPRDGRAHRLPAAHAAVAALLPQRAGGGPAPGHRLLDDPRDVSRPARGQRGARPVDLRPQPGDRPRPRPRGGLLAVHGQPLPRGARPARTRTRRHRGDAAQRRANDPLQLDHRGRGHGLAHRLPAELPQVHGHRRGGVRARRRDGGHHPHPRVPRAVGRAAPRAPEAPHRQRGPLVPALPGGHAAARRHRARHRRRARGGRAAGARRELGRRRCEDAARLSQRARGQRHARSRLPPQRRRAARPRGAGTARRRGPGRRLRPLPGADRRRPGRRHAPAPGRRAVAPRREAARLGDRRGRPAGRARGPGGHRAVPGGGRRGRRPVPRLPVGDLREPAAGRRDPRRPPPSSCSGS